MLKSQVNLACLTRQLDTGASITTSGDRVGNDIKIRRYYQGIGYPSDMEEHDEYGDWVKYEDVEPLLKRIKELEQQLEFERSLEDKM